MILRLLLNFLVIAALSGSAEAEERTRIGILLPLSGDASSVGEAIRNGITLGYEALSPALRSRLVLLYEDDALDPKKTVSGFQKLSSFNKLAAVVTAGSGSSNALAPIAESSKVPMLAIATDPNVVRGRSHVVNFWVTPEAVVDALLPEIRKRKYQRIARLMQIHDAMIFYKNEFDRRTAGEFQIVFDEEFPGDIRDFRSTITRLKSKGKIDALMLMFMPGQLSTFAKQARQQHIEAPFFGFEVFEDSNEVKLSDGALIGAWYANAADPSSEFLQKYTQRFPGASLYGAANGHDLVLLLGDAVEKCANNSECINHSLHEVKDFRGALGTFSATQDNRFTLKASVKQVFADGFRALP